MSKRETRLPATSLTHIDGPGTQAAVGGSTSMTAFNDSVKPKGAAYEEAQEPQNREVPGRGRMRRRRLSSGHFPGNPPHQEATRKAEPHSRWQRSVPVPFLWRGRLLGLTHAGRLAVHALLCSGQTRTARNGWKTCNRLSSPQ